MYMDEHKTEFDKLIQIRINLDEHIATLETTLSGMKNKYKVFAQNNSKKIYLYSLDSFYFQYKILSVEHENYKLILALINNRMYGDYYKLCVIIINQCKESNLCITISMDDIVAYNDLDPMFDYTIDDAKFIFGKITDVMAQLRGLCKSNNDVILSNNSNNEVGFSIAAFFTALKYENIALKEQIGMYVEFINFYQASQRGHCSKALSDIVGFSDGINMKILVNYQVETDALVEEPIVTEPAVSQEPVITEPIVAQEPVITELIVAEPIIAQEPVITEPVITEPIVAQEPVITEPVITEPIVAQEPVITEPVVTEPVVAQEPVITEPVVTEPVVAQEPVITEPIVTEPIVAQEPVITEPIVAEPVITEPIVAEPIVAEPVIAEPVITEPAVSQEPVITEPVVEEPVIAQELVTGPIIEQFQVPAVPKNNTPKSRGRPKLTLG
jgi:hypothetical protein